MPRQSLQKLKQKAPKLLVVSIIIIVVLILVAETLEDVLIEGSGFSGTLFTPLLNAIVKFAQGTTATVSSWGYYGVFLLMFLESTSLPIPSEIILPFAGYLVSLGQLNLLLTIVVSTVAGTTGSLVDYYIGMKGMDLMTRRITLTNVLFSKTRMEMVENWFKKYGSMTVFVSRLIPGFRTLISFPAGALKMSLTKFLAYTTAGCLIWSSLLIYLGYYLGSKWREVAGISRYLIIAFLIVTLILLVVFLINRRRIRPEPGVLVDGSSS
jgi:membrane protein DedA with SNARE-associated domain